ncbi:1-deoxy-D-xylulose-5-phosphate synthase [Bifidobacterium simiiventris]|uniref:1-deoxy-D-xylulose-5-phosphate synthase n=1 Tax=Bifidobacterium simiiventris TaxID=2834434 RepID=UPI001C564531|nr:1-deoxy-D-xylulose-5-phosphate synthase [Bifidobacterium simiiventris]MBW3077936.1 1-deoxy-D-xylulose-5-phosphate synthase [Bifidobacterium simiiventris]
MSGGMLHTIHGPADLHALDASQLPALCAEIRRTLIAYGHHHGGHIGSNLGMVEATVALHRVFDSPRDKIVFDVSHQSYVHKMLTGRADAYLDPTRNDEVTGFTNPDESAHDQFVLGHTGTSISLACGLAKTRDMTGGHEHVIAVIGDGSLSSSIAFEGLNNAAAQGGNLIIVFNDNEMSIAEDYGGMYGPLARLRESGGTAEPNIFKAFGLDYRYVEDGNDVAALVDAFTAVRDTDHPVVVHIHTRKGLGLPVADGTDTVDAAATTTCSVTADGTNTTDSSAALASGDDDNDSDSGDAVVAAEDLAVTEGRCEANHWINPDSAAGRPLGARKHYGQLAMAQLERRFAAEPGLVVISPATPGSNGITRAFRARAGKHYVDTGITEEHAVAFASGIARAGGRPVLATSATFFQRTFDQLQQELSLNHTPVTLLDFGGGLSGADNTHSGAFDIAMFGNIPGLTCLAPTSGQSFLDMLAWSTSPANDSPVVIRVPGDTILTTERANNDHVVLSSRHFERSEATQCHFERSETTHDSRHFERSEAESRNLVGATAPRKISPLAALGRNDMDKTAHPWERYRTDHAGSKVAILALGNEYPLGRQIVAALADGHDDTDGHAANHSPINATLIDPQQFSTIDEATLTALTEHHRLIVTLEDGQLEGGWGEKITAWYANHADSPATARMRVLNFGAAKEFTDRVPLAKLNDRYGLTVAHVTARIRAMLGR